MTVIGFGFAPKFRPIGADIVSRGPEAISVVLNSTLSLKRMLSAVLATNDPPIFKDAFSPKMMPLGFSRKRLAVAVVWSKPSMVERLAPVTRLKMFSISVKLLKIADPLVGIENVSKLWKRLFPVRSPFSMTKFWLSAEVTRVERVPSEIT